MRSPTINIIIVSLDNGGLNILFTLITSIKAINIIMPYLPANEVPFVDFKYIPNPTNSNAASNKCIPIALSSKALINEEPLPDNIPTLA